jgi:hypothetical protein
MAEQPARQEGVSFVQQCPHCRCRPLLEVVRFRRYQYSCAKRAVCPGLSGHPKTSIDDAAASWNAAVTYAMERKAQQ